MSTTEERENRQMLEGPVGRSDTPAERGSFWKPDGEQFSGEREWRRSSEEIRGVSALISDILQDFIVRVIESATIAE